MRFHFKNFLPAVCHEPFAFTPSFMPTANCLLVVGSRRYAVFGYFVLIARRKLLTAKCVLPLHKMLPPLVD